MRRQDHAAVVAGDLQVEPAMQAVHQHERSARARAPATSKSRWMGRSTHGLPMPAKSGVWHEAYQ